MVLSNARAETQNTVIEELAEDTEYTFRLRNIARDGSLSGYTANITHTPDSDGVPPPQPHVLPLFGVVGGFSFSRTPVDTSVVPDYSHTVITVTWTTTTPETLTRMIVTSDSSGTFGDHAPADTAQDFDISFSDVDRACLLYTSPSPRD